MGFEKNNEKKGNHKTRGMRNTLLYTILVVILTACGGDEETPKPTVVEGGKETTKTETVVQNPIDSTILNEYMKLLDEMKSQDSNSLDLDKQLLEMTKGNDSLMQMLLAMQDTLDIHLPVDIPNDTTDYDFPPNGNSKKLAYKLFPDLVPAKGKNILIPKEYRGYYANSNKATVTVDEKSIIYKSAKGRKTTIFLEGDDQRCRQIGDYCLLEYNTGSGWAIVTLDVKSGNLAFRIIPGKARIEATSSKKEWKKYLETNRRELYQVFNKVK